MSPTSYLFDMLFESSELEPSIIVFITYSFDPMENALERVMSGFVPQATSFRPKNYDQKITRDMIPAVETRYNTYLEFAAPEGCCRILRSPDHFWLFPRRSHDLTYAPPLPALLALVQPHELHDARRPLRKGAGR